MTQSRTTAARPTCDFEGGRGHCTAPATSHTKVRLADTDDWTWDFKRCDAHALLAERAAACGMEIEVRAITEVPA